MIQKLTVSAVFFGVMILAGPKFAFEVRLSSFCIMAFLRGF